MVGKHYNWHKAWHRQADGSLLHDSGLRVTIERGEGFSDFLADEATLEAFQAFEAARGVPFHDVAERLKRLIKEASQWRD